MCTDSCMCEDSYSLVQKAKDAETFGIVVGTLGVGM